MRRYRPCSCGFSSSTQLSLGVCARRDEYKCNSAGRKIVAETKIRRIMRQIKVADGGDQPDQQTWHRSTRCFAAVTALELAVANSPRPRPTMIRRATLDSGGRHCFTQVQTCSPRTTKDTGVAANGRSEVRGRHGHHLTTQGAHHRQRPRPDRYGARQLGALVANGVVAPRRPGEAAATYNGQTYGVPYAAAPSPWFVPTP